MTDVNLDDIEQRGAKPPAPLKVRSPRLVVVTEEERDWLVERVRSLETVLDRAHGHLLSVEDKLTECPSSVEVEVWETIQDIENELAEHDDG